MRARRRRMRARRPRMRARRRRMRASLGLAYPADLPSHGPSLIYIGYADLLRLPRTTPITQCGPIPTHRLSRSPTWSQRSFASDTVAAAGVGGEAGTAHSGPCRMFAGGRMAGGRPTDGSPWIELGWRWPDARARACRRCPPCFRSEDTTHAHNPVQASPGQARSGQTPHAAATRLPVRSTGQQPHPKSFCNLKLGGHLGRVKLAGINLGIPGLPLCTPLMPTPIIDATCCRLQLLTVARSSDLPQAAEPAQPASERAAPGHRLLPIGGLPGG